MIRLHANHEQVLRNVLAGKNPEDGLTINAAGSALRVLLRDDLLRMVRMSGPGMYQLTMKGRAALVPK